MAQDPPYLNQSLFSDYYLDEMVKYDPHWERVAARLPEIHRGVASILEKALPGLTKDTPEAELERRLVRPVLDIMGHFYHVQHNVRTPQGQKFPDYAFFASAEDQVLAEKEPDRRAFYGRAIAVGEAKHWNRPLDQRIQGIGDAFTNHNPSYQIDFYLRAANKRWGILTNGRLWRLYQRDLSYRLDVYYEVDLPAVLNLSNSAFLYFAAFFCRDALVPDTAGEAFLDRAFSDSIAYATRLSGELKENVYDALRLLTEGFLRLRSNGLTPAQLDVIRENAFTVIYRLLFIFYGESPRNGEFILPIDSATYRERYSLKAMAGEIAANIDRGSRLSPTITMYWQQLNELFRLIADGDEHLGVPAYNGGLFDNSKHPFLAEKRVGDLYLAQTIDLLARAKTSHATDRGFVAYSDLDVRELGSIYEGLLEHQPRIADEPMAVIRDGKRERVLPEREVSTETIIARYNIGDVYMVLHRGERRATGSYYTPAYIVKYMVQTTIGSLIASLPEGGKDVLDAVLNIKVLDPAMGSGHFLVEATDYLARALVESLGGDPQQMEEAEIRWARREVVERCIYGVDLNPLAVELAKLSLWLHTVSRNKPLNFLEHHLRRGNSLIGAPMKDLGTLPGQAAPRMKGVARSGPKAPASTLWENLFHQDVASAVENYFRITRLPSDTLIAVHDKENLYEANRRIVAPYAQVANAWTSVHFDNQIEAQQYDRLLGEIGSTVGKPERIAHPQWVERAQDIANSMGFFHWELEFPEVFFAKNGELLSDPGFDVVIGNPPYVSTREQSARGRDVEKAYLARAFQAPSGAFDIFVPMIERGLTLLNHGGHFGFIIPNKVWVADYARGLLELLKGSFRPTLVVDVSEAHVFPDVSVYPHLLFAKRRGESDQYPSTVTVMPRVRTAEQLLESERMLTVNETNLIEAIHGAEPLPGFSHIAPLGEMCTVQAGITGFQAEAMAGCLVDGEPHCSEELKCPFLVSGNIDRFEIIPGNTTYMKRRYLEPWCVQNASIITSGKWHLFKSKKIVIAGMVTRLEAAFDSVGYCVGVNVFSVTECKVDPAYLLALLNSRYLTHIYRQKFESKHLAGNYLAINKSQLEQLPIRCVHFSSASEDRETLVAKAKTLYKQELAASNFGPLLGFLDDCLPRRTDGRPDLTQEVSDVVHDLLAFLAEEMARLHRDNQDEIRRFLGWLETYLGISMDRLSDKTKIQHYWKSETPWETFRGALIANKRHISKVKLPSYQMEQPIREGFELSRDRLGPGINSIERTDRLIDEIVYRLYSLTKEEISAAEGLTQKKARP